MKLLGMLIVATLSFCAAPSSHARLFNIISHQELFDKSDLIVIARPVTKTADTKERTYFENIVSVDKEGKRSRVVAIGVETTFSISLVIKGDHASDRFTLHHFREPPPAPGEFPAMNGPMVVSFDPTDPQTHRDVLLFLVREKDGRYAPYGGQTDPVLAIFALEHPRWPRPIPENQTETRAEALGH